MIPLIDLMSRKVGVNPVRTVDTRLFHSHCTNDSTVATYLKGRDWGYWLNVAIRIRPTPCDAYMPYSSTEDVCIYDFIAPPGTPYCQDTFRPKQTTWRQFTIEVPIPLDEATQSCTSCVDYLIENLPKTGATGNLTEFASLQNEYAERRQDSSRSWWEGIIGGVITAPLFSKFREVLFDVIDYLLVEFLKIVGDILINLLNTILDLLKSSQSFINTLVDYITRILDVLFSLLALIIKIILGLLIQAEQHFLIFEYTTLFLFINYKFLNNNLFCLIIVIIIAIVFGVERNHPSLLLTFYNLQYSYVNFSYYNSAKFNYDYSLTYHNRTSGNHVNFTIKLPSLSQIPVYNLSISSYPINVPVYNITTNVTKCEDYHKYNTSSKP
jgi:hypothetical protein